MDHTCLRDRPLASNWPTRGVRQPPRRTCGALVALVVLVVLAGGAAGGCGNGGVAVSGADYRFTIPSGTGAASDRGEWTEILPTEMDVRVGETIEIVNDDGRTHIVGPFVVKLGETLRYTFSTPGELVGLCTLSPEGEMVIRVT